MTAGGVEYRVVREVGRGAFGAVYEAERKGHGLSRTVALKLLRADVADQPLVERRFRDEAKMLTLTRHRAIVTVEDLIRVDGAWCIVMEWVPGADLARLLGAGPIPPKAALAIGEEIASALNAAFTQAGPDGRPLRLVHRDVKPQNIRLTPLGEVKLLDFGVARAEFTSREASTRAVGMGTITYMAPERFRGEDTHAGDVYALGVTLFELLTAQPPGESAGDPDRAPPGRLLTAQWSWLAEELPAVRDLLVAMLDPVPERRPTAKECARRLSDLRGQMGGDTLEDWAEAMFAAPLPEARSGQASSLEGGLSLAVGRTLLHTGASAAPPPRKRPLSAAVAVVGGSAVVGALVVLALAGVLWSWDGSPPESTTPAEAAATMAGSGATAAPSPAPAPVATTTNAPTTSPEKPPVVAVPVAKPPPKPTASTPVATTPRASTRPPATAVAPAAAESAPVAVAPVAVAPAATQGHVSVSGAESVTLVGAGGSFSPGDVPPGTYSARVRFEGGVEIEVPGVSVVAGGVVRLKCNATFATCKVGS